MSESTIRICFGELAFGLNLASLFSSTVSDERLNEG